MKMHSYNLHCSLSLGSIVNQSRNSVKPRSQKSLTVRSSTLLQKFDENSSLLVSDRTSKPSYVTSSLISSPLTVGVIGGASSLSTLNFLNKLVSWSSKDGKESLPFIVCSDPELYKELSCIEKGLENSNGSYGAAVVEKLRNTREFLEKSGAGCIVMPFHVCKRWHDEICEGCSVPVFHVGECVALELKEANLKPVDTGSNVRIGVLATKATLKAEIYQEKLQNQGFEVLVPDAATMKHIVLPAMEAYERKDMEGARNLLSIAIRFLLMTAVNNVILASDELLRVLPHDDPLLRKCMNPMDSLARATIKWAQSQENSSKPM